MWRYEIITTFWRAQGIETWYDGLVCPPSVRLGRDSEDGSRSRDGTLSGWMEGPSVPTGTKGRVQ